MIKVLKGGLDPSNTSRYKFISGEVSNTRLMGVVAMHLRFEDLLLPAASTFHQFYYFDYEELGLETLRLSHTDDPKEVDRLVKEAFAGLGAELVELTEDESYFLANWMMEDTKKKNQPLPDETKEIEYIKLKARALDDKEMEMLNVKLCVPIKSDYGIANYFLMRCFGKDFEGAKLVSEEGVFDPSPKKHSTFLRNKIEVLSGADSPRKIFRCESLIEVEAEEKHHLVVTEIQVLRRKVVSSQLISDTPISLFEASLLLAKEEYISVFNMKEDADALDFTADFNVFSLGMTHNGHSGGEMFMDFKPNNDHAEAKIFMLSDDIRALYFVTDEGQVVTTAYSLGGIIEAETRLLFSPVGKYLELTNRYQFPASIIYDFAESGFTDFNEYLGAIE